jgi:hypothetical protein
MIEQIRAEQFLRISILIDAHHIEKSSMRERYGKREVAAVD